MKIKLMAAGAAVVVSCLAGYWYYSPYLAIDAMQAAAKAGDGKTLNAHVDYPALRESLKSQFMAAIADRAPKGDNERPLAAMGAMLGTVLANQMIDSLVRPETIMAMLAQGKTTPPDPSTKPSTVPAEPAPSSEAPESVEKKWRLERITMNKVIASRGELADAEGGLAGLVFYRSGFATWKLTEIRIPADTEPD